MRRKAVIQVGGAILSGLNVAIPLFLNAQGFFSQWPWQFHTLIGFIAFAGFMAWIVWDKQRLINKIRESIRFIASPGFLAINHPLGSEPPLNRDEVSINTTIHFEIWTDVDVHTAKLVLNVVGVRRIGWQQFWNVFLPKSRRMLGIRIEGEDTPTYRKQIKHTDTQPFKDKATFKWRGKRDIVDWGDGYFLELALETGSPKGIWRVIVNPDLHERGATTAL